MSGLKKRGKSIAALDAHRPISELDALNEAEDAVADNQQVEGAEVVVDVPRGTPPGVPTVMPDLPPLPDVPRPAPPAVIPCGLDDLPINSQAVVLPNEGSSLYLFNTPNGVANVPLDDVFRGLPIYAEVTREAANRFVGVQRDEAIGHAPLVATTAREVIGGFMRHFHSGT